MVFIPLCSSHYEHTYELNSEKIVIKFSPATLGDLADFTRYFKYNPLYELKEIIEEFPKEDRKQLLIDCLETCATRRAIVQIRVPGEIEKGKDGLPVKGAIESEVYVDQEIEYSFECPEVVAFTATHQGEIIQLYLSAKHEHPEIEIRDIRNLSTEERKEIMVKLYELNNLTTISEKDSSELKKSKHGEK